MMRIVCILLFALGVDHAVAMRLRAQEPEQVSGEVSCAECVITFDTVVTIGGLDGPGLDVVSFFSRVAVDRKGRILVFQAPYPDISVFDSTGRYLRTIGGRGEGPGEYGVISRTGVGHRYIHVFESRVGRTMLDHDFQVVRTERFPGQILSVAVASDDVAVFTANVPTPASVGHKLHILRPSGELASYGYDGGVYSSELTPWTTTEPAVAGKDDTVWAVQRDASRLVRWDLVPEPRVGRVFGRRVAEFEEGGDARKVPEDYDPTDRDQFAPAGLDAAMLDDRGLWLVWHSADPDWAGPPPSPESMDLPPMDVPPHPGAAAVPALIQVGPIRARHVIIARPRPGKCRRGAVSSATSGTGSAIAPRIAGWERAVRGTLAVCPGTPLLA